MRMGLYQITLNYNEVILDNKNKLGLNWAKLRSNWDLASLQLRSVGVGLTVMIG